MTETTSPPLPLAPGTWRIDPGGSGVSFKLRHLRLSHVHGRFTEFDATLVVGTDLEGTRLDATVDLSSVDTDRPERDAQLRSIPVFSPDAHQQMTFHSTAVRAQRQRTFEVEGDLEINGVTRPVIISVEFVGEQVSPDDGHVHAVFGGIFDIDRETFGIDLDESLGKEAIGVGKTVLVELDAHFVSPEPAAPGPPAS